MSESPVAGGRGRVGSSFSSSSESSITLRLVISETYERIRTHVPVAVLLFVSEGGVVATLQQKACEGRSEVHGRSHTYALSRGDVPR